MPPLNLSQLAIGERVQHELLVVDRLEKTQGNGDPFVILKLGNASGHIDVAPIWSNQREWADGADRGRVVQAIGQVGLYAKTGKRQIQLSGPLRVLPSEQVDLHAFLPRIAGDTTKLWDWIDKRRAEISAPTLRRVVDLFYADDNFRLKVELTPGSVNGHHAKLGGLLLHVFEVTSIAKATAKTMNANVDLVVAGALLHDIGKVDAYGIEGGVFAQTPCGLLLGHVVLGCLMLERKMAALGQTICSPGQLLDLQHMILSHHGSLEFGSPVQPMTTEAEIVHWADESSAKANDMMESLDDSEAFASGKEFSDKRPWRVGRRIWRRPDGTWDT
ncbi:MAG: metal dependent phosphohydrolase [Gemmatimonadetes bacterium]|nr:metal dependent phosphohydrolase [Gemmatimonadota bacterium]